LDKIVNIDRSVSALPDGGVSQNEFTFEPTIRDCNEEQPLEVLVYLDFDETLGGNVAIHAANAVPPSSRDPYRFDVPAEKLDPGCHQIEMRVSGKFQFRGSEPEEPGDLGRAVWWLAVVDEATPTIDMTSCPNEQL